jgi:SAM-dependent methyltransferase
MEEDRHEIIAHYEAIDEGSRITEGFGQLELVRTQEIIRRHLPSTPQRVVDIGGAKGVHAAWLAADGHHVHLIDLVPRHVEAARHLTTGRGRITAEVGDARKLPVDDAGFDAALLLGPLYHLLEREERIGALAEAARAVRPGGLVFAAAISRFASLFDGLARQFLFDPEFRSIVEADLRDGQHRNPTHRPHWFTAAYFHRPEELHEEVAESGLEPLELVGVEGLPGWLSSLSSRWESATDREAILYAARTTEAEPSLTGLSAHLLMVCRRPVDIAL